MNTSVAKRAPSLSLPSVALSLAIVSLALLSPPVSAQDSRTSGFIVGGHAEGATMSVEGSDRSGGAGGGALIGYGLTSALGVFGSFDISNVDIRNQATVAGTWSTTHVDLGVRYHFADPDKSVIPFVLTAATRRTVNVKDLPLTSPLPGDQIDLSGYAWTVGGGIMLYPTPFFSFDVEALLSWGSYTKGSFNGTEVPDIDALSSQSTRLKFGILVWL